MTSAAYAAWTTVRKPRIDELIDAHRAMGGQGPGRRWRTQQINWSLIMRIAGEFQGYCRDLHDLTVDHFANSVGGSNIPLRGVLRIQLTTNRQLDKGNAGPGQISQDFGRVGIDLWSAIYAAGGKKSGNWNQSLAKLIDMRNGIAHSDDGKIARLKTEGYHANLSQARKWIGHLDSLVLNMDDVVADYLDQLLGGGRPW